jgi:hypothetical protein
MFAMVVFGSVETAFADISYSYTTINVPGANPTIAQGINDSGQITLAAARANSIPGGQSEESS